MKLTELRGTGVAIITPFTNDFQVDYDALERVINFVIAGGINYIVSLGTTGETPVLTKDEKKQIINKTFEIVKNRVPVVVGIGGNNTNELLGNFREFPLKSATAVLSASPYYNKPSQEGIFQHYSALAKESPLPILLYNVPGRTGKNIEAATTLRLARVDKIAGIKEASGDMAQCMRILRDKPRDFLVVSGDDALALPQIACGMEGLISVAANAFPTELSQMVNAALANNFPEAVVKNNRLIRGYELMFAENNPAGIKAFVAEMGLIKNNLRLPLVPVSDDLLSSIRDYLKDTRK